MVGRNPEFLNRLIVGRSGITFVFCPVVLREFVVQAEHVIVAVGFGKDARGSDRQVFAIAFDYCAGRDFQ